MHKDDSAPATEKVTFLHRGNVALILASARATLGVSLAEIAQAVREYGGEMDEKRLEFLESDSSETSVSVQEWMALCSVLTLGLDDAQYGYSSHLHRSRVANAIRNGTLKLALRPDWLKSQLLGDEDLVEKTIIENK